MSKYFKNLPPLNTLVAFEAAYRLKNFSHAANEIARSQASVSRQIRQLEQDLGVTLFERRRHNVRVTPHGEAFAITVRLVLNELSMSVAEIRNSAREDESFTVFSDISIARAIITPVLGKFQQQNPGLQLKVLSSYYSIEETNERFDVGLQVGQFAQDRFNTEPIADDAIYPVCSAKFAETLDTNFRIEELESLPLLHLEDQGRGWPEWGDFMKLYGSKKTGALPGPVFTTYEVCLEAASQGEGVALGWARSVKPKIDEGKLVRLSHMVMPLPNCIHLYTSKHRALNPALNDFVRLLKQQITPVEI